MNQRFWPLAALFHIALHHGGAELDKFLLGLVEGVCKVALDTELSYNLIPHENRHDDIRLHEIGLEVARIGGKHC